MFAAELARSVGRLDWWNIRAEHTAYEWAAQKAMYAVCPFGERRADMRAGFNTANIIAAHAITEIPAEAFSEMVDHLISYLACDIDNENEEDVDMAALARIKEQT